MQAYKDHRKVRMESWVLENQEQFAMVAAEISWTEQVEEALSNSDPVAALQQLHKAMSISQMKPLSHMASGRLSALERKKVCILCSISGKASASMLILSVYAQPNLHHCHFQGCGGSNAFSGFQGIKCIFTVSRDQMHILPVCLPAAS